MTPTNDQAGQSDPTPPVLSIVIPAYGQTELTSRCIASLLSQPPDVPFEIVVVDDASEPPLEAAQLPAAAPLRLLRNRHNVGFAGSCNLGARAAQGRLLLLLNNDTEALPGWWQPLREAIGQHAGYGIVVPKLIFPDNTIQHCGKVWKDTSVPNGSAQHIYYKLPADAPCVNRSRVYTIVTGAALLVRRDEFLALGGFDEQYQNGWEDDDLCYAYRAKGLAAFYCAESVLIHHQSQTLNRELRNLEQAVADSGELGQLNEQLQKGTATAEDVRVAEQKLATMEQLEAAMDRFRQRYLNNRQYFFSKWGDQVERDDWRYYQADGFASDPDIPRYPVHLQQRLGLPFEQDPACCTVGEERRQPGLVSIVILTWNQLDYTQQCLQSIQRHTPEPHEIIFVDNGSSDGTVVWLQTQVAEHNNCRLIENRQNLGFAKGCNQGIEAARGEYILLLNNDVVVTQEWLSGLLECLTSSPTVGIVGPMTNNISGLQRVPQVGYQRLEELQAYAADYRRRYRHRRIPQRRIVGFCMLFRQELAARIGFLDEQFGSGNFEDDDYCIRAALAGYHNLIAADVFIHHYGSVSFQGNQCNYAAVMQGNNALFRAKWSRPLSGAEAVAGLVVKVLEKADLLHQRQEFEQLIEAVLQEGIRYAHDELRLYYGLARYLLDGNRFGEAEELLQAYSPGIQDAEGLTLLGWCRAGLGDATAAEALAGRAAQLDGSNPSTQCLHGVLAGMRGDHQQSQAAFQAAMVSDPGFGEAYTRLGLSVREQGQMQQGLALLATGFMLSPLSSLTREAYHQAVCADQEYERALDLFREGLQFYPQSKGICYLLVDLLLKARQLDEAMALIESALANFGAGSDLVEGALAVRRQLGGYRPEPGSGPTVSLCMIVKNEQAHLARCLHSLKPLVHELVIVDTDSTDATRELAEVFGARLFTQPWNGDFSAARNAALEQASGEWILVMDADEVIAPQDHSRFSGHLQADPTPCGYVMQTRNYRDSVSIEGWRANDGSYPLQEQGSGWTPSSKIRLFPNRPEIRFEKPVHELVDYSVERLGLPIRSLDVPVHHYGYLDADRQRSKQEQYYRLGCEKLRQAGAGDVKSLAELAVQAAELQYYQEAIALWEQVLALDPANVLAWFNLGYCYLQTGALRQALEVSRKALALAPNHREAALNGATAAFCLGDDGDAVALLQPFGQDNHPTMALLQACLGICSRNRHQQEQGMALLTTMQAQGMVLDNFFSGVLAKLEQAGNVERAKQLTLALDRQGMLPVACQDVVVVPAEDPSV